MFYTKLKLNNRTIKLPIKTNNIFAVCPGCGKEVEVNWLNAMMSKPEDIECIDIYCNECKQKINMMKRVQKVGGTHEAIRIRN